VYRHPYFDLYLHTDSELGDLLGSPILQRQTLQEWPLSCVQRLTTSDGRKRIYKAQHDPTVEPEFYAQARSSLLITANTIHHTGVYSAMLFDEIDSPTLEKLNLSESQALAFGRNLLQRIAQIDGELPHYLDVHTEQKWYERMGLVLSDLKGLVEAGIFQSVHLEDLVQLERWAFCEDVLATFQAGTGTVHNDLAGDNVFMLPDGPRLIDWQRPILGPTSLDLALLLESLGFDPLPYVGEGIVRLMRLLRIGWFTDCAVKWFPEGRETYDRQIAMLALGNVKENRENI
jgi:hypothetical protein